MNIVYAAVLEPLSRIDPGVRPNSNAPFIPTLQALAGNIMFAAIVIAVIAMIVGAIMFTVGKIGGNGRAQDAGFMIFIWVGLGAAVIGSASGLVAWFSAQSLS